MTLERLSHQRPYLSSLVLSFETLNHFHCFSDSTTISSYASFSISSFLTSKVLSSFGYKWIFLWQKKIWILQSNDARNKSWQRGGNSFLDIKIHKKMFLPKTGTHKEISLGVNFFQVISLKLDQLLKSKK